MSSRNKNVGVTNKRNSCYINVVVQLLFSIPNISQLFTDLVKTLPESGNEHIKDIEKILKQISETNDGLSVTPEFCTKVYNGGQKDASEILSTLFDQIDVLSQRNNEAANNILKLFRFYVNEESWCNGKIETTPPTKLNWIQLNHSDINENQSTVLIDNYLKLEQNRSLDRCKGNIIVQTNYNTDTCNYVIISLTRDRYYINTENIGINNKTNRSIIPDKILKIGENTFRLKRAVVHLGIDGNTGHYVFFKYNSDNTLTFINDDIIEDDIKEDQIFNNTESYSSLINQNATIFLYEKNEQNSSTLSRANSASSIYEIQNLLYTPLTEKRHCSLVEQYRNNEKKYKTLVKLCSTQEGIRLVKEAVKLSEKNLTPQEILITQIYQTANALILENTVKLDDEARHLATITIRTARNGITNAEEMTDSLLLAELANLFVYHKMNNKDENIIGEVNKYNDSIIKRTELVDKLMNLLRELANLNQTGGRTSSKSRSRVYATDKRIHFKGRERIVYRGSRGAEYIVRKGQFIRLTSLHRV